jgi:hypothetical protein
MYTIISTSIHRQRNNNLFVFSTTCFNYNGSSSGATDLKLQRLHVQVCAHDNLKIVCYKLGIVCHRKDGSILLH